MSEEFVKNYKVYCMDLPSEDIYNCIGQTEDVISKSPKFYKKLEESILREGFRNPILVCAGICPSIYLRNLPDKMRDDPNKILCCVKMGGSRLWVAQKHKLIVPCIVSDFKNIFNGFTEYENTSDLFQFFKDRPQWITFTNYGVSTAMLYASHLT